MVLKDGESHDRFYDRKGYYFRKGVDPRNYYGRFVPVELGHDEGCPAQWTYAEKCHCSKNVKVKEIG